MLVEIPEVEALPLAFEWPRWWSKLEVFQPTLSGGLLFFDLDTVIVGDLTDIVHTQQLTLLEDFYRPANLGSGLMYLPENVRSEVWDRWMDGPDKHMRHFRGDQNFLQAVWGDRPARWQHELPGQVVSYKVHVRRTGRVPRDARVICFHGHPRPWKLNKGLPK
jgi:hypothetical protein